MTLTNHHPYPDPGRVPTPTLRAPTPTEIPTVTDAPTLTDVTPTPTPTPTVTPTAPTPTLTRGRGLGGDAPTPTVTPTVTAVPDGDTVKIETAGKSSKGKSDTATPTPTVTPTPTGRDWLGAVRGWIGRSGYLFALTAIVTVVASLGQKKFAESKGFVGEISIGVYDFTPWFAPAVFDLAVAALLHGGLNAAKNRLSPWKWWIAATVVAVLSVITNTMHVGKEITAPASGGLFLIWGLYLYDEYRKVVRHRAVVDSQAPQFLDTDILFTVDPKWAARALYIAQTNPMAAALAYRHKVHGDVQATERDLAIRAARIYQQWYDDQLFCLLNPAAAVPAEAQQEDAVSNRPKKKVRRWHLRAYGRAVRIAKMTAGDAVDLYLGNPLPVRSGIATAEILYAPRPQAPAIEPSPVQADATVGRGPQPQLERPADDWQDEQPPPRRRAVAARRPAVPQSVEVDDAPDGPGEPPAGELVVLKPGQPGGLAGKNWMAIDEIPDVGELGLDPDVLCGHSANPEKPCPWTLVEHVQRRGKQIAQVVTERPDWALPDVRFTKPVMCDITGLSSAPAMEVIGLIGHLRKIAHEKLVEMQDAALPGETVPQQDPA